MLTSLLIIPVLGVLALSPMNEKELSSPDSGRIATSAAALSQNRNQPLLVNGDFKSPEQGHSSRSLGSRDHEMKNIALFVTVLTFLVSLLL